MRFRTGSFRAIGLVTAVVVASTAFGAAPAHAEDVLHTVLAVGAGPGAGAHVRAFRSNGSPGDQLASFNAYGDAFRGGVDVGLADLNGDGTSEIITGAGPGGGPHVRAFELDGTPIDTISFAGYAPTFHGGVHVGAADVDGDGDDEIVLGAGAGAGSHVRVFDIAEDGTPDLVCEFSAYGDAFRGGVFATGIWLSPNAETQSIVTSAGPGGGAHVRIFNGDCTPHPTLGAGFNAYPVPGYTGGAVVESIDFRNDGFEEVVTIARQGSGHVRSFNPDGSSHTGALNLAAYPGSNFTGNDVGGMFLHDPLEDESEDVLTGPGRFDIVRGFRFPDGSSSGINFNAFGGFTGGATIAGGFEVAPG